MMTPVQEQEMRRFTRTMWNLLECASASGGEVDLIFGNKIRSARILARRGFLTEPRRLSGGWYSANLTKVGCEAVQARPKRKDYLR
jgi:hypothetical protein